MTLTTSGEIPYSLQEYSTDIYMILPLTVTDPRIYTAIIRRRPESTMKIQWNAKSRCKEVRHA